MALPKINTVLYDLALPSSGEKIEYRPFLVKEEKILLMALERQDDKEMIKAVKQIVTQCVTNKDFDRIFCKFLKISILSETHDTIIVNF